MGTSVETAATVAAQLLAAKERANVTTSAIDSAERAERCLRENDWPLVAKLHGDYQSVALKNTDSELTTQDERLRTVLTQSCQRFGLIVTGYSGRDESVMTSLADVLSALTEFDGPLVTDRDGRSVNNMRAARSANVMGPVSRSPAREAQNGRSSSKDERT